MAKARPHTVIEPDRTAWADGAAFWLASLLGCVGFWLLVERAAYIPLLALGPEVNATQEGWLIVATACAESLLFLLPGLLLAWALRYARQVNASAVLLIGWASVVFAAEALDQQIYVAFGRHLSEVARFAVLSGGAQVAGGAGHWAIFVLRVVVESIIVCALGVLAVRWAVVAIATRVSRDFRLAMTLVALPTLGFGAALPWFVGVFFQHPDLRERSFKQLPWSPPAPVQADAEFKDPNWAALDAGLRKAYAEAFPRLFATRRLQVDADPARVRPNVVILLVESWRQDSLTPARMPRLAAWAEHGLVALQHYGGSDYSEAGMFSLLYGRSPLLFHAALDAHQPAAWCPTAHALGMECNYFSGHPKLWMRREEFLNPEAVDHFIHDDSGAWPDWDRTALDHAVTALNTPGARSQIALVYLMSTHFEYEYPAVYERHLPVKRDVSWRETDTRGLGATDQVPITNRYLNSLAFMDDLLADAIEKLDPKRNIIVLTGDHGESLGEDGHFGHGYGFPDSIAKVPFAIVGPGVPASHREAPSLHADLLATLVHALGSSATGPSEAQDLLGSAPARTGLLLAHCSYGHKVADVSLIHGRTRVRMELGLLSPTVSLLWPEDAAGHALGTASLDARAVKDLLATFESELSAIYSPTRSL